MATVITWIIKPASLISPTLSELPFSLITTKLLSFYGTLLHSFLVDNYSTLVIRRYWFVSARPYICKWQNCRGNIFSDFFLHGCGWHFIRMPPMVPWRLGKPIKDRRRRNFLLQFRIDSNNYGVSSVFSSGNNFPQSVFTKISCSWFKAFRRKLRQAST